jgi:glycosyltransferase involved in cell wall biosynthesis
MRCLEEAPSVATIARAAEAARPSNPVPELHVVHIVLSLDVGGLERVVIELAREGRRLGQKVSVICLERRGVLAKHLEDAGGRIIVLDKQPGLKPGIVKHIRSVLRELRPDVVHTHQIGALLYAGPAAQWEHVPAVVHTEHINNIKKNTSRFRRIKMRALWWFASRYAERFFCVSQDIADAAKRLITPEKVSVVCNGVDTSAFASRSERSSIRSSLGIPLKAPVIGTVGRLDEVKCQDLLIRAFSRVREHVNDAHLLLVGDGPQRQSLQTLAQELEVSNRVHFAGYQPQPQKFLAAMDLFALPSRLEGMPLVILEAWAAGLPVIASRVGGVPSLVNGSCGLMFDSGDQQALERLLLKLLTDSREADRMSRAGLKRAQLEFDTSVMAKNYQRSYMEILKTA